MVCFFHICLICYTMNLNSFVLLSQRIGIICNVLRHPLLESNILFSRKQITSWAVEDSILAIEKARVIRYAIASAKWAGTGHTVCVSYDADEEFSRIHTRAKHRHRARSARGILRDMQAEFYS